MHLPGDAPAEYGPHKTLHNRWKQWGDRGIFARTMAGLGVERGARPPDRSHRGRHEHQVARHSATARAGLPARSSPPLRSAITLEHGY